jgi:hypothetical protein
VKKERKKRRLSQSSLLTTLCRVLFSYLSIKTGVCPAYCQLYVRRRGAASLFLRRNSVYVFFLPILFDFSFSFFFYRNFPFFIIIIIILFFLLSRVQLVLLGGWWRLKSISMVPNNN